MGASTSEMYGDTTGAQPATPGSYGVAPSGYRLPDAARLGPVRLQISDLDRSVAYYETVLGLRSIDRVGAEAKLAAHGDDRVLVELIEVRGARPAPRAHLGLYHFAILLPDRPALGRFVRHLAQIGARAGAGDHLVSEAFYLQDPDGLGIEVYADRPREAWKRIDRELMMSTDPVDVNGLVEAAGNEPWIGMPAGTVMGHVHLHVGNLERAGDFYSEGLGFDKTVFRYPGALFMAAGGYHHHLGTNTWAGPAAQRPTDFDTRLVHFTLELPSVNDVVEAAVSLEKRGYAVQRPFEGEVITEDPWGTGIRIRVAPGGATDGAT